MTHSNTRNGTLVLLMDAPCFFALPRGSLKPSSPEDCGLICIRFLVVIVTFPFYIDSETLLNFTISAHFGTPRQDFADATDTISTKYHTLSDGASHERDIKEIVLLTSSLASHIILDRIHNGHSDSNTM